MDPPPAKTVMDILIECQCGESTRFSREELEAGDAHCPACGLHIVPAPEPEPATPEPTATALPLPPAPTARLRRQPSPGEELSHLRSRTHYRLLRKMLDWIFGLQCGGIICLGLAAIIAILSGHEPASGADGNAFIDIIECLGIVTISLLVLLAIRQATLLLIDIADVAVAHHARTQHHA